MKKLILFIAVASLFSLNAHADWDPVLEAREAAERKAEQQRAAKQKAEHDKMLRDANQKYMRAALGKEAAGKSDVEVERLHKQRTAEKQRKDAAAAATARKEADPQFKSLTGKSIGEVEKMSEKELDALAKALEKQYGVK